MLDFINVGTHCNFVTKSAQLRVKIRNFQISYLRSTKLEIYFIFGTKFSWNKGNDTCFNVDCVLLGHNFHFFGGYLVVTARYLVVTARYLVVTACYRSALLLSTFSMKARNFSMNARNNSNS